jgi:ATP adenylyltransferase
MDVLWAPWREKYVTSGAKEPGCVLCRAIEGATAPDSLVVHVGAHDFVVMNRYPYNPGHIMIAPRRHVATLQDATVEELTEMMSLARRAEDVFREVYKPDGMNIGMNLGRPAGAGVADHIHLHAVPRWIGDTNFMGVVGGVRVIPEEPGLAASRLRAFFAR